MSSLKIEYKVLEPKILESELVEPKILEPEILEPQIVEPELVEPEILEPELVEPQIVEPQIVEPELVEPEIVEPQIVEPQIVEPQIVEPEIVEPEFFKLYLFGKKIDKKYLFIIFFIIITLLILKNSFSVFTIAVLLPMLFSIFKEIFLDNVKYANFEYFIYVIGVLLMMPIAGHLINYNLLDKYDNLFKLEILKNPINPTHIFIFIWTIITILCVMYKKLFIGIYIFIILYVIGYTYFKTILIIFN
jgi:hypothetical protein